MTLIAITMGCPAGIGPEIICRLFQKHPTAVTNTVVIGDQGALTQAAGQLGLAVTIKPWQPGETLSPEVESALDALAHATRAALARLGDSTIETTDTST